MNKVVLVTGSSRGLGKETIIEFAKHGYDVIINYLKNENDALDLSKYIESNYKVNALAIKCDISKEEDIINMKNIINNKYSYIDVLVNNAGICNDTIFEDKDKNNFMSILETNLVGTFLVTKHIGKLILDSKNGSIINISSTNGIDTNYVESLDYDASKAGIINLTHNLAKYYSPNLRVNCVCPGWMDTDMNKNMDMEYKKHEESKVLLNRFAKPSEVAKVIFFLASDDASYINDSVIRVDGGVNRG